MRTFRRVKERRSLSYLTDSPSPLKERGMKGVSRGSLKEEV